MGSVNNKVGALEGNVIAFMKQTYVLEIVYANIQEKLAKLTSNMKAFLPSAPIAFSGQTTPLQLAELKRFASVVNIEFLQAHIVHVNASKPETTPICANTMMGNVFGG